MWMIDVSFKQFIHLQFQKIEMPTSAQCTDTYLKVSQGTNQGNQIATGSNTRVEGQYNLAALEIEPRVILQDGVIARSAISQLCFHA